MILIDTSAFIEFLNRTGSPEDIMIERLIRDNEDVALADITLTEILQGIKSDTDYETVKRSLLTFPVLSLKNIESFAAAADLYRRCRKKGLTVRSTVDLIIARIAIEHDAELLHKDRDFDSLAKVWPLKLAAR